MLQIEEQKLMICNKPRNQKFELGVHQVGKDLKYISYISQKKFYDDFEI